VHLPQGKVDSSVLGKEMSDNLHKFRASDRAQMRRVQITREPMPYGNVLVVDDVETNIYVAKGLMAPYELKIDSADSGFAAIEKIKNGNVYDIVFMDHMMPKMDGIEATKIMRSMGYERPIVALTANAVAGQADIFLGNGFDDFISKPIDIRQLNTVLNKLIRDKQAQEVIETARRQKEQSPDSSPKTPRPGIDPRFAEIFARDANKSLAALDAIIERGAYDENDVRTYVIHTHGMKSALANIGKMDLSAVALKLEQLGRNNNIEVITSETPAFLSVLRAFVDEIAPHKKNEENEEKTGGETADEDRPYLREKLLAIKAACEEYDKNAADDALAELRKKMWSEPTRKLMDAISEHLLHSDFDEVVDAVDKFMEHAG
jgi:CheY-like chemotaxis protein/HPt (histidine-containing phosphotransfer) domain-containing protein